MNPGLRRILLKLFLLVLTGLILLLCILQAEYLVVPMWLDAVGRLVYRMAFFVVLPFRFIVALFIPRTDYHWPVSHFIIASLGTPFFLFLMAYAGRGIIRFFSRVTTAMKPVRPSRDVIGRRQFLLRSTAGALGIATGGVGTYASLVAPERLKIVRYEIPVADLPHDLDGLRLIHVSDTHYGPYTSMTFLEHMVEQVNALHGDIVVLTGDYVHFTPKAVEQGIGVLGELRGRFGVIGVLGNHDHWEGVEACRAVFKRTGIPLLDNKHLYVTRNGITDESHPGRTLCMAGVGDLWEDEVSFVKALSGVSRAVPRIVLSHNPDSAESVSTHDRVDLMLSGHTHGGQVNLPGVGAPLVPSRYGEKYLSGLCHGPNCFVIVSRGVGLAGVPLRFRVPPEVGAITLRKA